MFFSSFSLEVILMPNQLTSKDKAISKKGAIRPYKNISKEIVDGKRLEIANKNLGSEIVARKGAQC